jgi:ferredoxin
MRTSEKFPGVIMAHTSARAGYRDLVERLNRFPQGAPPSRLLHRILELLLSEREARHVALLPIRPFTVETASRAWNLSLAESGRLLDGLAGRGILLDIEENGRSMYVLPPPMAGFFEFSMMRVRDDVDQKVLAELFYEYLNVEEDFIKALFANGETNLGRVFVHEPAVPPELSLHVLDYERASHIIRSATDIAIGVCYCRHKMEHLGKACGAPREICMTFNNTASSLIRHRIARKVDREECLSLLDEAYENNLVQFGENVRERVNFICNCCGCCCEAMIAGRRFGFLHPVHTSNFLPRLDEGTCNGCGKCISLCPVNALSLVSANDPKKKNRRIARLDGGVCLGCGVCTRVCPVEAIRLSPRAERVLTPVNSAHRVVLMAIERGKLQNLIFDNQALASHRVMAAILGVILKLPPLQRILASRQMKSRYLEFLFTKIQV